MPGIHAFEHYVAGLLSYQSVLREVAGAEQDPKFRPPTFEEWTASSEAKAAIAARVTWQERYEEKLADPVKDAFYRSRNHNLHHGNFMEALVFAEGGEQLVAKRPLSAERTLGARRIEAAASALVLQDKVHPTLEQIRGFSYAHGIVTVYKPGRPPAALPPEELEMVRKEHIEFALEGLAAGASSGVKLDSVGQNMVVDPQGNINFFDLNRLSRFTTDFLLEANFNGFLRLLGDASMGAPKVERDKIRAHLHKQGLAVIRAIDPDFVHTDAY